MSRVALLLLLAINFAFANFATKSALGFILQGLDREHNLTKKLNMINSAIKLAKYEDNNTILLMNLYDAKSIVATALDDINLTISSIDKTIELSKKVSNDLYYNYLLAKANYLIHFKDYSSAKKIIDNILKTYPNKNGALYFFAKKTLIKYYNKTKNYKKAYELVDKLIEKYKFRRGFSKDELYDLYNQKLYILMFKLNNYQKAEVVLDDMKNHFGIDENIRYQEAILKEKEAEYSEASKLYNDLLKDKTLNNYLKSSIFLNLIELDIISNKKIDKNRFDKYKLSIVKDELEEFEMLKILYDAKYSNQDNKIKKFKDEYNKKVLNWSFDLLDRWVNSITNKEIKDREKRYIEFFKSYNE